MSYGDRGSYLTSAKLEGRSTIRAPPKRGVLRKLFIFRDLDGCVIFSSMFGGVEKIKMRVFEVVEVHSPTAFCTWAMIQDSVIHNAFLLMPNLSPRPP